MVCFVSSSCHTWMAVILSSPHGSIFSDKFVLRMGFLSGHVTESEWGKKNSTSRVSDDKFAADANRNWQKNQQNCKGLLNQKKQHFFFPHCCFFYSWPKGLNVKVVYSCLDENQEGGSPTRIFCKVVAPLRLLHPRQFDRRSWQRRVWRCHLLILRTWMMLASISETLVTPGTQPHPLPKPPIKIFYPSVWALPTSRRTEVGAGTTPVRTGCRHPLRWPWPQKQTPAAEAWSQIWSC